MVASSYNCGVNEKDSVEVGFGPRYAGTGSTRVVAQNLAFVCTDCEGGVHPKPVFADDKESAHYGAARAVRAENACFK